MEEIKLDIKIGEIIEQHPGIIDVFIANGFDKEALENMDYSTMLGTILKVRNINHEIFTDLLQKKILEKETKMDFSIQDNFERKRLDFLGNCPCPVKHLLRDGLEESIKDEGEFETSVAQGCGSYNEYDDIWELEDIDELPDVIVGYGFDGFFSKNFIDRYIKTKKYNWVFPEKVNSLYSDAGCIDSENAYTMYSSFSLIITVDNKLIGELTMPQNWDDLLKDEYKGKIVIPGSKDGVVAELFLLYIHQAYGDEGLRKLASNVKGIWHPAKIAKMAGNKSSECVPVYIMPYFFAKSCEKDCLEIIWPKDGGVVNPMFMLVKSGQGEKLKPIIDFISGEKFGNLLSDISFPSFRADVDNKLPIEAKYKWLGWDYIRENDMNELKEHVKNVFESAYERV